MSDSDNTQNQNKNNEEEKLSPAYAVALGYDPNKDNSAKSPRQRPKPNRRKDYSDCHWRRIGNPSRRRFGGKLKAVDIDQEIPVEAFAAVAEIISYVYKDNNRLLNKE